MSLTRELAVINDKKIVCIIPARLQSTRFPQKVLASLAGKPLLQWVWEAASKVSFFDEIIFAVDAEQTAQLVRSFGAPAHMTSVKCLCGTDRMIELYKNGALTGDIWVNWQADEPFVAQEMIQSLLQSCDDDSIDVWTLKKRIYDDASVQSSNIVKVVADVCDRAIYFSRSPIPYYRDKLEKGEQMVYYKHVGLYAYTAQALNKISSLQQTNLEKAESLEQLRFLQHAMTIKVHETDQDVIGIDTPSDLLKAELFVEQSFK